MFWVFESAQKMKLLAFILLFSSHCEGSLESVYRKRAVLFFSGPVLTADSSNLVESAVKTFIEKKAVGIKIRFTYNKWTLVLLRYLSDIISNRLKKGPFDIMVD